MQESANMSLPLSHQSSTLSSSSEKFKIMKAFNITVKEYLRNKSDMKSAEINKYLAHIVSDIETSIFDPHNAVTSEFYVNLFELMNIFDSSSGGLVWCAVGVLERACNNSEARQSLIHTYRFIPVLSKLLLNVVVTDKKIRILSLMQELTYGIKITWQEPHLAVLMNQLLEWVKSENENLAILALSVMVNICYKNLPSTYILTRLVDTKVFIKSLVRLQASSNPMRVQLWKMVIILNGMAGESSISDLFGFIQIAFTSVSEFLKNKNRSMLQHIVDFFIDTVGQSSTQKVLYEYPTFANDVNNLLVTAENSSSLADPSGDGDNYSAGDPKCMALLFEFLHSLLILELPELSPLHPRLVTLALKWVEQKPSSSQALHLLKTIAQQCTESENSMSSVILEQLSQGFTFHVLSMQGENLFADTPERVTSMIELLLAMAKRRTLVDKILINVKESWVDSIFSPILDDDDERPNLNSSSQEYTSMYIHCLSLVAQLACLNYKQWALYLIQLLRKPSIQSVIARAFYTGSASLREQVMRLIQYRECEFPIFDVAKIMCDLGPIVIANSSSNPCQNFSDLSMPILSVVQQGRLDKLLSKFEEAVNRNQLSNPVTSEVMELYEYKLAAMSHAERSAQSSLESAGQQITSLNHRLALMSKELERLHGMLYTIQLSHEKLVNDKKISSTRMAEMEIQLKEFNDQLQKEKEKRIKTVNDLKLRLENTEIRLTSCLAELEHVNAVYSQCIQEKTKLENKNKDYCSVLEKYEEKYKNYKNKVEEDEKALVHNQKKINELTKELEGLQQIRFDLEQKLSEKEKHVVKLSDDLRELEQMRDLIATISSKKRNI